MLQFHFYGLLTLQWERASLLHVLNDHTQRTEVFSSRGSLGQWQHSDIGEKIKYLEFLGPV